MRAAVALSMALSACVPAVEPGAGEPPSGRCDASRLGDLVGRVQDFELLQRAQRESGARSARVIRPGDMVTMDYREDRLNIHVDSSRRVDRFTCG